MKTSTKIILIVGAFALVILAFIFQFLRLVKGVATDVIRTNTAIDIQIDEINSQPNLGCKVISTDSLLTPFSQKPAALYLLKVGYERWGNYRSRSSSGSRREKIGEDMDYTFVAIAAPGTMLSIGNKEFRVNFEQCILVKPRNNEPYWGIKGTREIIWNPDKSYLVKERNPLEKTVLQFKEKHPWIESYFSKQGIDNIILQEYIFRDGDSLYLKGRVTDGKIIPYTEHFLEDFGK